MRKANHEPQHVSASSDVPPLYLEVGTIIDDFLKGFARSGLYGADKEEAASRLISRQVVMAHEEVPALLQKCDMSDHVHEILALHDACPEEQDYTDGPPEIEVYTFAVPVTAQVREDIAYLVASGFRGFMINGVANNLVCDELGEEADGVLQHRENRLDDESRVPWRGKRPAPFSVHMGENVRHSLQELLDSGLFGADLPEVTETVIARQIPTTYAEALPRLQQNAEVPSETSNILQNHQSERSHEGSNGEAFKTEAVDVSVTNPIAIDLAHLVADQFYGSTFRQAAERVLLDGLDESLELARKMAGLREKRGSAVV